MEFTEFCGLLEAIFEKNKIPKPNEKQLLRFYQFTEYLVEVNQHTNLTAVRTIPEIICKHYADSLFFVEQFDDQAKILDLGCGPGFPSIPIAIMRPDLQITALDSTQKKIRFVSEAAGHLKLERLTPIAARAEEFSVRKALGQFDVVVSRAVARLNILCELALPYVRIGGTMLAFKASQATEELAEARNAMALLGGSFVRILPFHLYSQDGTTESRALIQIQKQKETPPTYPRSYAAILKKPL